MPGAVRHDHQHNVEDIINFDVVPPDSVQVAVLSRTVVLSDEQIRGLPTVAVPLVAAPGSGKVILPIAMFGILDTTGGAYTGVTGAGWDVFVGPSGANLVLNTIPADTALEAAGDIRPLGTSGLLAVGSGNFDGFNVGWTSPGATLSDWENQPLFIKDQWKGGGNYADGGDGNSMTVTVLYVLVDV